MYLNILILQNMQGIQLFVARNKNYEMNKNITVKKDIWTVWILKNKFWDVTSYSSEKAQCLRGIYHLHLDPEDGNSMFLWNIYELHDITTRNTTLHRHHCVKKPLFCM
jgi:hypothetical protein